MTDDKLDEMEFRDLFYNEVIIDGRTDATDSASLEETSILTELSFMGNRAWAIQEIEFDFADAMAQLLYGLVVLPTPIMNLVAAVGGRGATPSLIDTPLADRPRDLKRASACGASLIAADAVVASGPTDNQYVWRPPTPIPFADRRISLYLQTDVDYTPMRDVQVSAIIRFSMIPTSPELWREIYELRALKEA